MLPAGWRGRNPGRSRRSRGLESAGAEAQQDRPVGGVAVDQVLLVLEEVDHVAPPRRTPGPLHAPGAVAGLQASGRQALGGASTLRVLTEGLRYLKADRYVRAYLLAKPAVAWALGGFGLFSTYSIAIYGAGDPGTALLFAGRGIGAFLSPLLVSGAASLNDTPRLHRFIVTGMGLVIVGYFLFAFTRSPLAGMICAGIAHWGNAWAMTLSGLIVQASTPDYVRGRVLALDNVGWALVSSLSNLVVAAAAVRFSPQWGVLIAVMLSAVCVVWWLIGTRTIEQAGPKPAE